jgi:hypothetical protein
MSILAMNVRYPTSAGFTRLRRRTAKMCTNLIGRLRRYRNRLRLRWRSYRLALVSASSESHRRSKRQAENNRFHLRFPFSFKRINSLPFQGSGEPEGSPARFSRRCRYYSVGAFSVEPSGSVVAAGAGFSTRW